MPEISDRQQEILDAVEALTAERGYPPTVREVGDRVGLSSTSTIHTHLRNLAARGLLAWEPSSPRTLMRVERDPEAPPFRPPRRGRPPGGERAERPPGHYGTSEAARLTGASVRQLDYWDRSGCLSPSIGARGSGGTRFYSSADLVIAAVFAASARMLRSVDGLAPAVDVLRDALPGLDPGAVLVVGSDGTARVDGGVEAAGVPIDGCWVLPLTRFVRLRDALAVLDAATTDALAVAS